MKKKPLAPLHVFNDTKKTRIRSYLNREQIKQKFNITENQNNEKQNRTTNKKKSHCKKNNYPFAKSQNSLISPAFFFTNANI